METKTRRNLSGVYFRIENKDTGKYENVVFEDMNDLQQDEVMNDRSEEWLRSLIKTLANTLNEIGDGLDIEKH